MKPSVLQLLPLSSGRILKSRRDRVSLLYLLTKITEELLEAISNFINEDYRSFDAQVGETLCQTRAYKICVLANDKNFKRELLSLRNTTLEYELKVKKCLQEIIFDSSKLHSYDQYLDSKEPIIDFFTRLQLLFLLTDDQLFIATAYFLSKYCITDANYIPNAINYNAIKEKFDIGTTSAKNLSIHYQVLLAKLSSAFILQDLPLYFKDQTIITKRMTQAGDRGRQSAPYYLATKLLLHRKLSAEIPIVILINIFSPSYISNSKTQHVLVFRKNTHNDKMELTDGIKIMNYPCIVFSGVSLNEKNISFEKYKQNIIDTGLEKIILCNAASHPQYTGHKLAMHSAFPFNTLELQDKTEQLHDTLNVLIEEFNRTKKTAFNIGCARNNPTFFHIQHIFCSTVNHYVNSQNIPFLKNEGDNMSQILHEHDLILDELVLERKVRNF